MGSWLPAFSACRRYAFRSYSILLRMKKDGCNCSRLFVVEHTGFEPVTSTLPVWHSSQLS